MARARVSLVVAALLLASLAARADGNVEAAKKAEAAAFAAIDEERWCDAMHSFLDANEAAPSIDLIYNAALAADEAQDRKQALKLYIELLGAYPNSDRGETVNSRVAELTAAVQKDGDGSPCPAREVAAPPSSEPTPEAAAPPAAPTEDASSSSDASAIVPWVVVGVGGALAAAGATVAVVGALPYADFLGARDEILAAERAGSDAAALQVRQQSAREAWTSWGELTMWAGAATSVVGLGVAAGGVVWAIAGSGEE